MQTLNPLLCSGLLLAGLALFCLAMAHPVQAEGWQGTPPLTNEFKEHEFLAACWEGNLPAVEYYLQHGDVQVNDYFLSGQISGLALTGLYLAAYTGNRLLTHYLLQNGADPDVRISTGWTPLLTASEQGHADIVQMLIDAKANPNRGQGQKPGQGPGPNDGTTPLMMAAQYGHTEVAQILLNNGARANCRLRDGTSALFCAAQNGYGTIVDLLVDAKADPTEKWHYDVIFTRTPRDAAWWSCPSFRWVNPKRYDTYAPIIATLKQAERNWRRTGGTTVQQSNTGDAGQQPPEQTVTERTPLLHAITQHSVSSKFGSCAWLRPPWRR